MFHFSGYEATVVAGWFVMFCITVEELYLNRIFINFHTHKTWFDMHTE